jgi:drug/metabolite transporter (DMT)-like permease
MLSETGGDMFAAIGPPRVGRGVLYANLAVILFGLAGVLGKLSGLPAPLIVLGRVVFAGITLGAVVLIRRPAIPLLRPQDMLLLGATGALLAAHWTSFFQSVNVSSVAVGLLSYSTFPLFTALLEPLVFRQRASRVQAAGGLAILGGVYLLVPSLSLTDNVTVGVVWGLVAGATFAVLSVTNRWLGRRYPSVTISLSQDLIATLVLLPTLILVQPTTPPGMRELLILLILGIGCTAVAHTLFIEGMRDISAQLASLSGCVEPVWGIVFALLFLGEVPSGRTLLGGVVILAATSIPTIAALRRSGRERPV